MKTYVQVDVSLIFPIRHGEGAVDTFIEQQAVEEVKSALAEINTISDVEVIDIAGIVQVG